MIDRHHVRLMATYNHWMNQKLYAACAGLTDQERKADKGAFFKSLHSTLNHILWGDRAWMSRFTQTEYVMPPINQDLYDDFEELRRQREAMDQMILDWSKNVSDQWLATPMTWTSKLYKKTLTQPTWALVAHLFNHQTHHRGQVTALLSQCGVDPGITDLPMLPELDFENFSGA